MSEKPQDRLNEFVEVIAEHNTEGTVRSIKCDIRGAIRYLEESDKDTHRMTPECVAEHIADVFPKYSTETLYAKINSLSNYIAYNNQRNPRVVRQKIKRELSLLSTRAQQRLASSSKNDRNRTETGNRQAIRLLLSYLHECRYGSRTHGITELITATGCRITETCQLDISDVNLQQGYITLSTSKEYAIPSQPYVLDLPETCIDALDTYCNHERIADHEDNTTALFTTSMGRISSTTLRRSVKKASEAAFEYHSSQPISETPSKAQNRSVVTPRDLRVYNQLNTNQ